MAKKSNSTSKTAHVMNLLSKNQQPAQDDGTSELEASIQASQQPSQPGQEQNVPSFIASLNSDSAISSQIKSALEDSVDNEQVAAQPAPEPAPPLTSRPAAPAAAAPSSAPAPAPAVSEPVQPDPEPVAAAPAAPEFTAPAPAPAQTPVHFSQPVEALDRPDVTYVNVMQYLVEEKAEKYMKAAGVCTCPRCLADVKAFALNRLAPKYVVMYPGEMVPRITLYDGQFSAAIATQLTFACETVKSRPHHNR